MAPQRGSGASARTPTLTLVVIAAVALFVNTACANEDSSTSARGGSAGRASDEAGGGASSGKGGESDGAMGPQLDAAMSSCKATDDPGVAVGLCTHQSPPNSFEPDVQWSWVGQGSETDSVVIPLVANLTDDNHDGAIDLCDVPDVVVVAYDPQQFSFDTQPAHLYVLDGKTGSMEIAFAKAVAAWTTPALGDIDHDGVPEVVTITSDHHLIAFQHDGTVKWENTSEPIISTQGTAIALADLDHDGRVEIVAGVEVFDDTGKHLWNAGEAGSFEAPTLVDLDGDGKMEVLVAGAGLGAAYHSDGSLYFQSSLPFGADKYWFPAVANLDDDPEPEILLSGTHETLILEHDGTIKAQVPKVMRAPVELGFPTTVADFDGDGFADFGVSAGLGFTVYRRDGSLLWSAVVSDLSGIAGCTAFDFLGAGFAEAIYADESTLFVWGEHGAPLFNVPRSSQTYIEYPVVADIDNDGSAEVLVVSNATIGPNKSPAVRAIRDKQDRWVSTRRIWNEHTYHVTNVREDGTIPQFEPPHWKSFNTFRANAQIEAGHDCKPPVPNPK